MTPPAFRLRPAREADMAQVVAVAERELGPALEAALGHGMARRHARWRALLAEGGLQVVEVAGEVAGCLHLAPVADHVFLSALCVDPRWQGRGLARAAVEAALAAHPGQECRVEVLRAGQARGFWDRLGFVVTAADDTDWFMVRPPRGRGAAGRTGLQNHPEEGMSPPGQSGPGLAGRRGL